MPLYMDIHKQLEGVTPEALAEAHHLDEAAQEKHGVEYLKYWFNADSGHVCCLVEAPNAEAAIEVHKEAHGLLPDDIIEVEPKLVELFMGSNAPNPDGAAISVGVNDKGLDPGVRTILFTDIHGSTSLTQRLGDEAAHKLIRIHDGIVRDGLSRYGGREVKHTGDGLMASFASAVGAVRSGIDIQRAFVEHNGQQSEQPLQVRLGFAAGEPVEDGPDLFGASVQLAARLCDYAQPGQIVVSNVVAELCLGKGIEFESCGPLSLKGFPEPVHAHEVRW